MTTILGTVRSGGQGVAGLRAVAYEEVQIGIEDVDDLGGRAKPCRVSHPIIRLVGETTTDSAGQYRIAFDETEPFEGACSFSAKAYIRLYDGSVFVQVSSKRTVTPSIRIDFDLGPPPTDGDEDESAAIAGTLTLCSRPATGFQVSATESIRIGIEDPESRPPCQISTITRNLGVDTVDGNGSYRITFTPRNLEEFACFYQANVIIKVFTPGQVWISETRPLIGSVRFDAEVAPGCDSGGSLVRVADTFGQLARDAEVFVNGEARGRTDQLGHLVVNGLAAGDRLAARLLLHENATGREAHGQDSDQNWNYRAYATSVPIIHDANGDNVELPLIEVVDPTEIQEVTASRNNTLIGLNLRVSVEWDATRTDLNYMRDRLLETSQLIYNATDGQFCIERLTIDDDGAFWDEADLRVYANTNYHSNVSDLGAFFGAQGYTHMNPSDALYPAAWLHELGHYVFGPDDEYEPADDWDPNKDPPRCTLAITDEGGPFADLGSKAACLMYRMQEHPLRKFCSAHPNNPHVHGTAQGDRDCWSEILERFGDARWRLKTPVGRRAIPDRLPDSGEPFVLGTSAPSDTDDPSSYIPVAAWQPQVAIRNVNRSNECPNQRARTTFNSSPVNDVGVTLITADGRRLYQGVTRDGFTYPDGVMIAPGEVRLRGAHIGDQVVAFLYIADGTYLGGAATITQCDGPVIISLSVGQLPDEVLPLVNLSAPRSGLMERQSLPRIVGDAPDVTVRFNDATETVGLPVHAGVARLAAVPPGDHDLEFVATHFDDGRPVTVTTAAALRAVPDDAPLRAFSADGVLLLRLPSGALPSRSQVAIETIAFEPRPPLEEGNRLVAGPYRLDSTKGASLRRAGRLVFDLRDSIEASPSGEPLAALVLLVFDATSGAWRPLPSTVQGDPPLLAANIDSLGVFALIRTSDEFGVKRRG